MRAENNKSLSESKNSDGHHLKFSLVLPETKDILKSRGLANSQRDR